MSRNSRKGFKKLNTHELVELNRHGRAESGSESEILDLTTVDEPRNGCCSRYVKCVLGTAWLQGLGGGGGSVHDLWIG